MKKKILLGIAGLLILFIVWVIYGLFIAEPKSPPAVASYNGDDINISVSYSQPYVRGRLIFGAKEDGALQPFGEYWRLGANAATEITLSKDVLFAGEAVPAGSYRMYAVPGPDAFDITLNTELGVFFGISEPDHDLDVVTVKAPVTQMNEPTEMFTIQFDRDSTAVQMEFLWDTYKFVVPIELQN